MEKKKTQKSISNVEYHDTRGNGKAKPTGSQVGEFTVCNVNVVEPVNNFNKYIKENSHIGYKAYSEIQDFEKEFVIPRQTKDTIKLDTLVVCPGFRIKPTLAEIEEFKNSGDFLYFEEYVNMLKTDEQFKNCKILSAIVHFDEVHFPKSEYDEAGKWVRDYTEEESIEKAYIPVHMHISYIPLSKQTSKDGIEYLKLDHNFVWKGDGCKYWQTFTEFNDKCYEKLGKTFDVNRGTVWEDWKDRTTNADETVKKQRKLNDYKKDQEEERLQGMLRKAKAEQEEAIKEMNNEKLSNQAEIDKLKKILIEQRRITDEEIAEMEEIRESAKKLKNKEKQVQQETKDRIIQAYNNADKAMKKANDIVRILTRIELALKNKEMSDIEALQELRKGKLDDVIRSFKKEDAPELHRIKNLFLGDDPR